MPAFLEAILKKRYGADSSVPFKIMNAKGFMRGNQETAKGAEAEAKHEAKGGPLTRAARGKRG